MRGERAASEAQRGRGEQERTELLLLAAGAVVWLGKEMSRRCSGYRIVRLWYQLLVVELTLGSSRILTLIERG